MQRRRQTRRDNRATPEGGEKYNPSVEAGIGRVFNANERLLEYINYFQQQYKKIWHNDLNNIRTKNTKQSEEYGDHTQRIDVANSQLATIQAKLEEVRKLIEKYKTDFQLQKAY
jgi:DNA repair ATPase RecN